MILRTSRITYNGTGRLDITVKSADPAGRIFAPTWELVSGHKRFVNPDDPRWKNAAPLTDEQYTAQYYDLLRQRYRHDVNAFVDLLKIDELVLCCYCAVGKFCHRHLAADILLKIAQSRHFNVQYTGEI